MNEPNKLMTDGSLPGRVFAITALLLSICLFDSSVVAQNVLRIPEGHDLQDGTMPTGVIGSQRHLVRPEMIGYMQPIKFVLPEGARLGIWDGAHYQILSADNPTVRLGVGAVYRLKVTRIPRLRGKELFPSIEILNRLYPPEGQDDQFPVVVHITQDEFEKAVNGQFVNRVTYLEDPETALPFQQVKGDQSYFQVDERQDALKVAASLGRPMTMVRMGSRIPLGNSGGAFEMGKAKFEIIGPSLHQEFSRQVETAANTGRTRSVQPMVGNETKRMSAAEIRRAMLATSPSLTTPRGVRNDPRSRSLQAENNAPQSRIRNNPFEILAKEQSSKNRVSRTPDSIFKSNVNSSQNRPGKIR
jgi:hypothetical protein